MTRDDTGLGHDMEHDPRRSPSSPPMGEDLPEVTTDFARSITQLNSLLRGEISAAETYRMAIDKLSNGSADEQAAHVLRQIQEEHGRAAQSLRARIRELGGEPSDTSGAWGAWAKLVQRTGNLLGDTAALASLREGEEHGLKDYQEALNDLDSTSGAMITTQLLPSQRRHIDALNRLGERHNVA